ncbi:unnamed protein product [Ilex paraguariensis]|uniref:ATP synthase F0 subunit 8 n=1 Tax=Ilex paraguariensis TaxID=185542 RepID=A0ABC8SAF7_9AQUA
MEILLIYLLFVISGVLIMWFVMYNCLKITENKTRSLESIVGSDGFRHRMRVIVRGGGGGGSRSGSAVGVGGINSSSVMRPTTSASCAGGNGGHNSGAGRVCEGGRTAQTSGAYGSIHGGAEDACGRGG